MAGILYIDSSALVKRYIQESGTKEVMSWMGEAISNGTTLISRAEVSSAVQRTLRMKQITSKSAQAAMDLFRKEWTGLIRIPITEQLIGRADLLAYELGLRGYDAVHLAAALVWQESLGLPVTMVTYDRELVAGAEKTGLDVLPGR